GTATFDDGAVSIGQATLNASGIATFVASSLTAGSHTISVVYGGDSNFTVSASNSLTQNVTQAASSTTLTSSVNPSGSGQSVTFTATVNSGAGTVTGTVTFEDGSTTLGSATLAAGSATFASASLTQGSHTLTAVYGGNTNFGASTSANYTQTVIQATTTLLTSSINPAFIGQSVSFTATVSGSPGTPTGTVIFLDGSASLGSATLAAGSAVFTASNLSPGGQTITAVYAGNGTFAGSSSAGLSEMVADLVLTPGGVAVTINATLGSGVQALRGQSGTTQIGTLNRNGVASTVASPKSFPGLSVIGPTTARTFDLY